MKVRFIINPIAGGGPAKNLADEVTEAVRRVLGSEQGIFEVRITSGRGDARRLSKEAKDKGYEFVFACGGDGTVNEVASELVGSDTTLGIIASGSGNGLARALGIPKGVEPAVRLVTKGRIRRIDAGLFEGRYFFSTAGAGFDALLSKRYGERKGALRRRGVLPYYFLALAEYFRYDPGPCVIKANGKYSRLTPLILTIANTEQFGADAVIAPGALPDDGLLDLCLLPKTGFLGALRAAFRFLRGRIHTLKAYRRIRTDTLQLTRRSPGPVHVDGEYFDAGENLTVGVLPRALKVLVA